jgi:hypothetical protein
VYSTLKISDSNIVANDDAPFNGGHVAIVYGKVDLSNVVFANLKNKSQKAIAIQDDNNPSGDYLDIFTNLPYHGSLVTCNAPVYFCPQIRDIEETPTTKHVYYPEYKESMVQRFNNTNCNTAGNMVDESQCFRWFTWPY